MLIECKNCEAVVDANVLYSYKYYNPEEGFPGKYSFLKCPKCAGPFIIVQEDYGRGLDEPYRLYPPQDKRIDPSFPEPIRNAYKEAKASFKCKAFTAV